MTGRQASQAGERADLERCLQELSRGCGVLRKDLMSLLQGDLSRLRRHWGLDVEDGIDVVTAGMSATLEGHVSNLYPRWGRQVLVDADPTEVRRYRAVARVGFNISRWSELYGMNLMERWAWLQKPRVSEKLERQSREKPPVIPESTSRHLFRQIIEQIAERMANGVAVPGVSGTARTDLGAPIQLSSPPRNLVAHLLQMSGQVREALDAARNACQARHRAVYTFDVLLALLDMPGGRVRSCFEDVASGLSDRVRQGLLAMPDPGKQQHPFVPFEWVERDDMQLAWQYTLSDARPAVSDLHLLLAILDSQSETNLWLKRCLRHEHAQVRALTDGRRHSGPTTIKSPTPN